MPWVMPPWIWPSTIIGFTWTPTSSTATYLRIFVLPVSVSTSTAHEVGAVRVGEHLRVDGGLAEEVRVHAVGQVVRGERLKATACIVLAESGSPFTAERAVDELQVVATDLEQVPGDLPGLVDRRLGGAFRMATPPTASEREP